MSSLVLNTQHSDWMGDHLDIILCWLSNLELMWVEVLISPMLWGFFSGFPGFPPSVKSAPRYSQAACALWSDMGHIWPHIIYAPLDWFASYLSGRSQRILFDGVTSDSFDLGSGVSQGSCLCPLLFVMYTSKLFEIVQAHLPDVHCFADDTQLYLSFKSNSSADQAEAVRAIESCIHDLRKWMFQDKLKINDHY